MPTTAIANIAVRDAALPLTGRDDQQPRDDEDAACTLGTVPRHGALGSRG